MKVRILVGVGTLVAIAVAGWVLAPPSVQERRQITLPNGTIVRLVDVTYGTEHRQKRSLREHLWNWYLAFRGRGATAAHQASSAKPTIGLWFNSSDVFYGSDLVLSTGEGAEVLVPHERTGLQGNLRFFLLRAFPRGSKMLEVKSILRSDAERPVYSESFRFENPAPLPAVKAPLVAQSLPARSMDRGTEFLASGLFLPEPGTAPGATNHWNSLTYMVKRPGYSESDWFAKVTKIADSHGNEVGNYFHSSGRNKTLFQSGLWPDLPWKLGLEYHRISNFAPQEVASILDIPVPAPGAFTKLNRQVSIQGTTLRLMAIANQYYEEGIDNIDFSDLALVLGRHPGQIVRLEEAFDDQGRKVAANGSQGSGNESRFFLELKPEAGARTVSVRISLVDIYHAEVILQPTAARSGSGP